MLEIALALIPLFLLLAALLCGHYPGLRTIVRISERIWSSSRRHVARRHSRPRVPRVRTIRGGLLLAFGFAQRPPPLAP